MRVNKIINITLLKLDKVSLSIYLKNSHFFSFHQSQESQFPPPPPPFYAQYQQCSFTPSTFPGKVKSGGENVHDK